MQAVQRIKLSCAISQKHTEHPPHSLFLDLWSGSVVGMHGYYEVF